MEPTNSKPKEVVSQPKSAPKPSRDLLRSKRVWATLSVILFLIAGGTLIPAGKIPFVGRLVQAMGYSAEEAGKISFFKALLSWNERYKQIKSERPDPNEQAVFDRAEAASRAAHLDSLGRQPDGLLNMQAVNALLRKQGRAADQISSVLAPPADPDEKTKTNISVTNPDATAQTEANRAMPSDVYFGAEANVVERDKNDGFDSVKQLKKVNAKGISGFTGGGTSWIDSQLNKAVQKEVSFEGLEDSLKMHGMAAKLNNIEAVGDSNGARNLFWAWMASNAARRANNVVLKKTLATTSFDGAELPRTIFDASGFSGISINPDDVLTDLDHIKQYLEMNKKCQEAVASVKTEAYERKLGEMVITIKGLSGKIPATCADRGKGSEFDAGVSSIRSTCETVMIPAYTQIKDGCASLTIKKADTCRDVGFAGAGATFQSWCENELRECIQQNPTNPGGCNDEINKKTWDKATTDPNSGITKKKTELEKDIAFVYYAENGKGLSTDYFPSTDWQQTLNNSLAGF